MHLSPYAQYRLIAASARDCERTPGGRKFLKVMEFILMLGSAAVVAMFGGIAFAFIALLAHMAGIIN
jgi:hypothetical protein